MAPTSLATMSRGRRGHRRGGGLLPPEVRRLVPPWIPVGGCLGRLPDEHSGDDARVEAPCWACAAGGVVGDGRCRERRRRRRLPVDWLDRVEDGLLEASGAADHRRDGDVGSAGACGGRAWVACGGVPDPV